MKLLAILAATVLLEGFASADIRPQNMENPRRCARSGHAIGASLAEFRLQPFR
jgi:hypothetical protein